MKNSSSRFRGILCILGLLLIFLFGSAGVSFAQNSAPAGKIVNFSGQVDVLPAGGPTGRPATVGQLLQAGDVIVTGANGKAAILVADESLIQINKSSRFVLREVAAKAWWQTVRAKVVSGTQAVQSLFRLERGELWFRNKNKDIQVRMETPTAICGVRGTEMHLKVGDDQTVTLTVLEGSVQAQNELGTLEVARKEQMVARPGMPLAKTVLLTPEDAVQWIIPIPPLFDERDATPDVRQAWFRLQAGDVKETQHMMQAVTQANPEQSSAWSLLALTSLMLGQKAQALDAANKAVAAGPQSVLALLIQSYALQASFDLDRALAATRKALDLDRTNVLALNNLARLLFGMDDIDEAYRVVQEAQRIAPDSGEVQNLLGFILLGREKTDEAISAFNRAASLDPSLGEPHMGLGIASMRKADTGTAMEEISTAVLLEPRRSLFLSYWGKMLYQIERFDKAMDMLKLAGEMDPRDPTPELYKSFIYRDQNLPTEAITAVNKSMALNDNRAVYRSRFLLDRDAAVKNIDLSLLYYELGLSGWARSKALASVKQDYANASGHLFLAGSLLDVDDRSWAMQSEFLLARMLMPANVNSFNTFNEYTAFFEKPALNGTISGAIGSDNARQGNVIAYGALPAANVAFVAQGSYIGTNGWRDTNGEKLKNASAMLKWNPTAKDGIMAVASYGKINLDDTADSRYEYHPRFNNDILWDPNDRLDNEVKQFELGYHRRFSPNSHLLLYAAHVDNSQTRYDKTAWQDPVWGPIDATLDNRYPYYTQLQGQVMHRRGSHQVIVGTNQYFGDDDQVSTLYFPNFNTTLPPTRDSKRKDMQSYYIQDTWRIAGTLTLEGAVYYDRMVHGDPQYGTDWTVSEWGWRIGAIVTPTGADTLRLAAFRYLLPFITSRLDPADVAGVPVFRNNFEGSLMEEYHGVWEHEWSSGYLSTDLFYLEKKYTHKIVDTAGNEAIQNDQGRTKGIEAILNQLLWQGLGLALGYRYQDVKDDNNPVNDREEHLVHAGLRYLHSSGLSAGLSQTFRWERFNTINWQNSQTWPAEGRQDQRIWLTDAQIAYAFPRKKGSLALQMRNIFDQRFNWVTDNYVYKGRSPSRETILTLTFNF